jgi:hypothetical protein
MKDYSGNKALAKKLIEKYGGSVTITNDTTSHLGSAVFDSKKTSRVDLVKQWDLYVYYWSIDGYVPNEGDYLNTLGGEYIITAVTPIEPRPGEPIYFEIGVKK